MTEIYARDAVVVHSRRPDAPVSHLLGRFTLTAVTDTVCVFFDCLFRLWP
jgi:hypothetical protein